MRLLERAPELVLAKEYDRPLLSAVRDPAVFGALVGAAESSGQLQNLLAVADRDQRTVFHHSCSVRTNQEFPARNPPYCTAILTLIKQVGVSAFLARNSVGMIFYIHHNNCDLIQF